MLDVIANQIKNCWNFYRVKVDGDKVDTDLSLLPYMPSFLIDDENRLDHRKLIETLYEAVGALRLDRVGRRVDVDVREHYALGMPLTVGEIKRLFVGLGDVYLEDLLEIYLQDPTLFEGRRFDELTKEDFDILYNKAVPFDNVLTMFCGEVPTSFERSMLSDPKSYEQMRIRVYLNEMKRRRKGSSMAEVVNYMKRINHIELPEGLIIPGRKGYHQVYRSVHGGGARFTLLKKLHEGIRSRISYMGTSATGLATIYDDCRPNLGCRGAISTVDELGYFLNNPAAGFVSSRTEWIDMDAFSLGEAHASRHAALYLNRVKKLRFVDGAGIDTATLEEMAQRINELSHKIKIRYYWEEDSMISRMGDGHIGYQVNPDKADVKLRILSPVIANKPAEKSFPARPLRPENPIYAFWHLFTCLIGAHLRVTADDFARPHFLYRVYSLSNQRLGERAHVNKELSNEDSAWEKMRRVFSYGSTTEFIDFWHLRVTA